MEEEPLSDEPVDVAPRRYVPPGVLQRAAPVRLPAQTNSFSVSSPAPQEDDTQQRQAMARALALMNAEQAVKAARQFMAQRQYHQLKAAGVPDEQLPLDVVANAFGAQAAPLLNARRLAAQKAFVPQFVPPDVASGAPGYMRSGMHGETVRMMPKTPDAAFAPQFVPADPNTGSPAYMRSGVKGSTVHLIPKEVQGKWSDDQKYLYLEDSKRRAQLEREMDRGLSIALKDPKSPLHPKAVGAQAELDAIQKRMADLRSKQQLPAQSAGVKVRRKADGKEFVYRGNPATVPEDKYEVVTEEEDENDERE